MYEYLIDKFISIHALLAESDGRPKRLKSRRCVFLSTLSLRRATRNGQNIKRRHKISIHALLAESDGDNGQNYIASIISIHALLAESDDWKPTDSAIRLLFLSTLSLRRATAKVHKTVGHFCAYETNFMGIASSC